ncbi:hypothetical protein Clacol_009722 [Clathrus columnatus]|uniref:Uncharacterized protein n=1 Tax=Clathrus columnatus TaxID=1419009 RepID=A0AAV5ARR7_9AGAM|nr:hypothetical protein Clacol_009722 [Clathrus columnatus]
MKNSRHVNPEQIQKLFVENFVRHLLVAHGKHLNFTCTPNPSSEELTKRVLIYLGKNGGMVPGALAHTCVNCTHRKREQTTEYLHLNQEFEGVVGFDSVSPIESAAGVIDLENSSQPNEGVKWVRMAVMDGKTLSHKKNAGNLW